MKRKYISQADDDLNILSSVSRNEKAPKRRKRLLPWLALLLAATVTMTGIYAFFIEPRLLSITHLTVSGPDLPDSWDGRTIAFFSDTHLGPDYTVGQLGKLADAVIAAAPDLILFGGDLVDYRTPTDEAYEQSVGDVLARMQAPLGKYAISGNHDTRLRAELLLMSRMLRRGGFELMLNESVVLDGIWLGGLEESYFGNPDYGKAFSDAGLIEPSGQTGETGAAGPAGSETRPGFRILLMHQPDYAADRLIDQADLILSGHSHNGQVTFFGKPLMTVYQGSRYPYGQYGLSARSTMIVSRGLGTVGLPVRLFAAPELMLITLKKN